MKEMTSRYKNSSASIVVDASNENHHIWDNNGTWWMHYTVYPTAVTVKRVRKSLKTKDPHKARERRDIILSSLIHMPEAL